MKKILAFILTILMISSIASPVVAVAASAEEATPIIYIRGNGEPIYNAQGERIPTEITEVQFGGDDENSKDKIVEAVANILIPFLAEGMLMDKWDNYAQAIYDELSPLLAESDLDGDGNAQYGTGVSPTVLENSEKRSHTDRSVNGLFNVYDYAFCFDWRLDPYDHVDRLHEYICNIMEATGKSQVSIYSRCLGSQVLSAYLEKYAHLGHVKNVMYADSLAGGCTVISKGLSGKVEFDSKFMQRYMGQMAHCGEIGYGIGVEIPELAQDIITTALDLFTQVGVADAVIDGIEDLYDRLYKALVPALLYALGYANKPIYWTMVYEEDFDQAIELMFGEEGSEARTHYAGLIEKITYYREHVNSRLPELLKKWNEEYGIHIGTLSKYGYLNPPLTADYDAVNDALVNLADASFGATTARVGEKLSDDYIAERIAEGKGKYISPDKQVDLSTCLFPDTAWVFKNSHHDIAESTVLVVREFCRGTNMTVEKSDYPAFMMYDEETGEWSEMTEDNCADLDFMSSATEKPTLQTKLAALLRFITALISLITKLINGEISFG